MEIVESYRGRPPKYPNYVKFMLSLNENVYREIEAESIRLGVTVQDVIRNILGEWADKK